MRAWREADRRSAPGADEAVERRAARAGRRAPRLAAVGVVATPGSGKATAMLTLLEHLEPRAGGPPELLGELPLADEAAREAGAAAMRRPAAPGPAGGAPTPA